MEFLNVQHLTKNFDGVSAVNDVSFTVEQHEIFAIIGPNGAGKTTTFNLLSGVLSADHGDVYFKGSRIRNMKPHEIALRGMIRTFQTISLFDSMSVLDNVRVGCHSRIKGNILSAAFRTRRFYQQEAEITHRAFEALRLVKLEGLAHEMVGNLPFGQQRLVDIARALVGEPILLMLDEPAAGMNARERKDLMAIIKTLQQCGMTIILIEHDMDLIMEIAERIIVLDHGIKIAEGTPEEIQQNPEVIAAYLGEA